MRLFEIFPDQSEEQKLYELTKSVRDRVYQQYRDFANTCDIGADWLADLLESEGYHGHIIDGIYRTKYERAGHRWVEVNGYILDPTREQFGGKKLVQHRDQVKIYIARDVIRTF